MYNRLIIKFIFYFFIMFNHAQGHDYHDNELSFHPKSWLSTDVPELIYNNTYEKADSYQVITTKKYSAVKKLESKKFVKLSEIEAHLYTGLSCHNHEGKEPYLVRGLSNNFGSGNIVAIWFPDIKSLNVVFTSLGGGGVYNFVPLVVYLPETPNKAWVSTT